MSHLVSDTVARIKNAQLVKQLHTKAFFSRQVKSVLSVLVKGGFLLKIEEYNEREGVKMLKVYLKYDGKHQISVINEFYVISKPGKRVFQSYKNLPMMYGGLGMLVLSTSRGIINDSEARRIKVGGEVLCAIF